MGLFTAGGCVSRILGPVAVGSIYTRYGTRWTFGITMLMMVFPMIWLYMLRDRLDVDALELKVVEMKNLNGGTNGVSKTNGTNGLIKDKSVIINEMNGGEEDKFISNGK